MTPCWHRAPPFRTSDRLRVRQAGRVTTSTRAHAPGSPGALGYLVAIVVSLVAFGWFAGVDGALKDGRWSDVGGQVFPIVVFGALPAAVIGTLGATLVHVLCVRARRQVWHVLCAGLVGFGAGYLLFPGLGVGTPLALGCATALGRLAVVPFVVHRRQAGPRPERASLVSTPR